MVEVKYSHRLIGDSSFCMWLCEQPSREIILSNLMHIKSSSKDWKKTHNLILKTEADYCKDKIQQKYLGAAFKIMEDPSFLDNYRLKSTKNIIFGIEITDETPFRCYLLTSPEKEIEYRNNPHFKNIQNLQIISGNEALIIIQDFFNAFSQAREEQRY